MLLSIVIPSFNQGAFIERTIQSVLAQSCRDYELIVVDAVSTDETQEILRRYANQCSYVVVEKDKGQADAINKGVRLASGRFVTWLNSDDLLLPEALENFRRQIDKHPRDRWFMGNTIWIDANDRVIKCARGLTFKHGLLKKYKIWDAAAPMAFIERTLWEDIGGVDDTLHYNFDTDLWIKLIMHGCAYRRIGWYCWGFRLHTTGKTSAHHFANTGHTGQYLEKRRVERHRVADRYGLPMVHNRVWGERYCKLLRLLTGVYLAGRVDTIRYRGRDARTLDR